VASYSEAYKRLKHLAGAFFVTSLLAALLCFINNQLWVSLIWLAAGISVIGANRLAVGRLGDCNTNLWTNESIDQDTRSEVGERAFSRQFLLLSFTIGVAAMASAFALERCWWSCVLIALTAWFSSMILIPVICAPVDMLDE
jgi:hypothetical protein